MSSKNQQQTASGGELDHPEAQAIGVGVAALNATRIEALQETLADQDVHLQEALSEMQKVRDFVGSPANILGNPSTKHGEIAEQLEVGLRRAKDVLDGKAPSATFEGVGRTAPADYLVGGVEVQSKFINGESNALQHVLDHLKKHDFARNEELYQIPSDQYDTIQEVLQTGEGNRYVGDLHSRTIRALREKARAIEQETGRSFEEVVRPADADYGEVQRSTIHEAIDDREDSLRDGSEQKKEALRSENGPSVNEGVKAAAGAAAVGAVVRGLPVIIQKWRGDGKNPFRGDYEIDDWEELGLEAGKGAVAGGITGGAIYVMTNCASLSAPLAGTVASASRGVASLAKSYRNREISANEFAEESQIVCSEAAFVGIGTAIGQTVIPVPVLGALAGSVASQFALHLAKEHLDEKDAAFAESLEAHYNESVARLDAGHRELLEALEREAAEISQLMDIAFDSDLNARTLLDASIVLAETFGVEDEQILRDVSDVDAFMQPQTTTSVAN